jgi:hypothetical protein
MEEVVGMSFDPDPETEDSDLTDDELLDSLGRTMDKDSPPRSA